MNGARNEAVTARRFGFAAGVLCIALSAQSCGTGVGLIFFPNLEILSNSATCMVREEAVPIGSLDSSLRKELADALYGQPLYGDTPTHDAFRYALDTLKVSTRSDDKVVVLITDGQPNYGLGCVGPLFNAADPAPLVQEAATALSTFGIRTFVIGDPGSEGARDVLAQMAHCSAQLASDCYFDLTTAPDLPSALDRALSTIAKQTRSCNYALPGPPNLATEAPDRVKVAITSGASFAVLLRKDSDPADGCTQGWEFTANNTQIRLCPEACELARSHADSMVELRLDCSTL